jgi:uncharacterized membrane protein YphA (DoxX/SURF4 family)
MMNGALLAARLLLAVVFGVAGLAKLADRSGSRQAVIDFGVPPSLATPFATLLPMAELAVAGTLITHTYRVVGRDRGTSAAAPLCCGH